MIKTYRQRNAHTHTQRREGDKQRNGDIERQREKETDQHGERDKQTKKIGNKKIQKY